MSPPERPSDLFDLADEWQSLGEFDWALAEYTRLHDAGLGGADTLIHRAALHREAGRLACAERDFEEAARLEPDLPWALLRHAEVLDLMYRPLAALSARERALQRNSHPEVQVFAVHGRLAVHWLDAAYRIARDLPPDLPDWWAGVRERAVTSWKGMHAHARALLRTRRQAADPHACALELADALVRLGRLSPARRLAESMMRRHPEDYRSFDLYRRILEREKGADAAAAFLSGVGYLHRDHPAYRRALALLLHDLGRYAEVLEVVGPETDAGELDDVRSARVVASIMLGRTGEMRRMCRDWMRLAPRSSVPAGFIVSTALAPAFDVEHRPGPTQGAGIVLAQFWDDPNVPEDVAATMASWSEHHPALDRRVFHTESARAFLLDRFGAEAAAAFDSSRHAAMKADLFRIAHLLVEGGVWADADELCVRPMDPILAQAGRVDLLAPLSGDTPGYVHNLFMGARPGSRVFALALEEAVAQISAQTREGARIDIWQTTGPGLITRAAARFLLEAEGEEAGVLLFAFRQYRAYSVTNVDLAYKRRVANNWHAQ